MMSTEFYHRCIKNLERAQALLVQQKVEDTSYDLYRSACIKEFELILEQSAKLLRKILQAYFHSSKAVDRLSFKDVFRYAGKHGLLSLEEVERWLEYRDNRNTTAHDYGVDFADKTLALLPQFIEDAKNMEKILRAKQDD